MSNVMVAAAGKNFVNHGVPQCATSCKWEAATITFPVATQKCSNVPGTCKTRREVLTSYAQYADRTFREVLESLHYSRVEQPYTNGGRVRHREVTSARRGREIAAAAACEATAILKPLWNLFSGETGGKAFRRLLQLHSEAFRQLLMEQEHSLDTFRRTQACGEKAVDRLWTSERETKKSTRNKPESLSAIISRATEAIPNSVLDGTSEDTAVNWDI